MYAAEKEVNCRLKNTQGFDLVERLSLCPQGREHWVVFQKLCKDILTYLFVPPLSEPIVESRTGTGHQRRDLIFPIPYDAAGFWALIRSRYYAEALIVDCKNYSNPIGQDEITHISRYLGKEGLGLFAIVISRLPPAKSAIKEILRLWRNEGKLIVCLCDDDFKKMIELKEKGQEPEKVIDEIRFDMLVLSE